MCGKDRFGKPGHIELKKFRTKLISYDLIDFKNDIAEGKIFKCIFKCEIIGEYPMYYNTLEKFLEGVEGMTKDKISLELLEKKKKNMLSEEALKKDLFRMLNAKKGD